ncbi:MAG TPA: diguanylate cyclase [Mariprofundaceae bacterium]|nr:diguanylate cyclase [Mariprofundaceae bacterium]
MTDRYLSLDRKLILITTLVLLLATLAASAYYLKNEQQDMRLLLLKEARVLFKQIQITRHWNAEHGGVYTFLKPGEKTNPYLYKVGPGNGQKSEVEPELTDSHGRTLTLKNPALMTRELAEESSKHSDVRFHLTSLKLINPNNAPDAFEKRSLEQFQAGRKEAFATEDIDDKPYYRYMAPLKIENACLKCHGFQGYKVGDIRGGLSVSIPMQDELQFVAASRRQTFVFALLLFASVVVTLSISVRRIVTRPLSGLLAFSRRMGSENLGEPSAVFKADEIGELARALLATDHRVRKQQEELQDYADSMEDLSRKDALTGLHNRHHLTQEAERWLEYARRSEKSVCMAMVDVDHFKQVNDTYGHFSGDMALQQVAAIIAEECRTYDQIIRYGGDEFLLIFLDTATNEGLFICERIRRRIESASIPIEQGEIRLSVSIGLFCCADCTMDEGIIHADEALYQAKAKGRNRICHSDPPSLEPSLDSLT